MKYLLVIILLTIFTYNNEAQIIHDYGLKLGVGISNQSWDYLYNVNMDFDNKIGMSPRIFADFFSLSFFRFQTELGYLQKGFEDKIPITTTAQPDGTGEFVSINNRVNYLSFSALAKFKYDTGVLSPYLIVGPQFNFLISKEIDKGWEVIFDKFKKNNMGISAGAGAEINNVLPVTMLIEYRYERDFIDNYESAYIDIRNYSHVILVGVKL